MDDTGPLTLLMNVVGPILLGLALFFGAYYGWRRRRPGAQAQSEAATKNLYSRVEDERQRAEKD
jgi:hypothetical protein